MFTHDVNLPKSLIKLEWFENDAQTFEILFILKSQWSHSIAAIRTE